MDKKQVKIGVNNVYVSPRGFVYLGDMICPVNKLNWTVKIRDDWHSLEKIVHKKFPRWTTRDFSNDAYEFEVNRWYQKQSEDINLRVTEELREFDLKVEKQRKKILESFTLDYKVINDIYEEY